MGCKTSPRDEPREEPREKTPAATPAPSDNPQRQRVDLLERAAGCEIHHRGLIVDFTGPEADAERGFAFGSRLEAKTVERAGVQLRVLDATSNSLDFWWWHETTKLELTALVRPERSERLTFSIDGRIVGTVKTRPGEMATLALPLRDFNLGKGRHRLAVATPRGRGGGGLEVAWVRLGQEPQSYGGDQPMTRSEALSEVTVAGERKRSVVLREGGAFECPLWLGPGRRQLKGSVGLWGSGSAEAEIWAEQGNGAETMLGRFSIAKEDARGWQPIELELPASEAGFVRLSWRALHVAEGARLAFAEPHLVEPSLPNTSAPRAQRALLIVMSGLSQSDNPPHAEDHGLGFLQRLAAEGTSFPGYRVSTTSAQAAMVSMLSGTSPWVHQMSEDERSWPRTVPRLAEIVEAHAGQTAMFSGVPHSFAPFGFAQGFEVFEQISPVADLAAVEPARRARAWLGARLNDRGPLLTVLHLRGGHPPFDVNHDTALELPPAEYGGDLDPRRAAIQLLSIRSRTRAAGRVMPEEDWIRLAALRKRALLDQSAVLAQLFGMLREGNAWDDSLIIVVGDAASGLRPAIPFDEHAPLSEELLSVPLLVKFPHKYLAGRPVAGNFSPRDVFATLAQGLGLEVPAETIPLGSARAEHDARGRAHVAFRDGHFVARLGPYLLSGQNGRVPKLCRVDLDPACSLDRYLDEPLPVRVLWLETHRALADTASSSAETFEPGEELAAALTVWGATR